MAIFKQIKLTDEQFLTAREILKEINDVTNACYKKIIELHSEEVASLIMSNAIDTLQCNSIATMTYLEDNKQELIDEICNNTKINALKICEDYLKLYKEEQEDER